MVSGVTGAIRVPLKSFIYPYICIPLKDMKSTERKGLSRIGGMAGAVKRHRELRRGSTSEEPPKGMSITERLYYLRERGYGIQTVGGIELSKLGKQLDADTISRPQFLKGLREIALTMESMYAQKKEDKRTNAEKR